MVGARDAVCSDCVVREEEDYTAVKEYLADHPNADAAEISEATGVSPSVIGHFVKRGFLVFSNQSFARTCRICGKAIDSGELCAQCHKNMIAVGGKLGSPGKRKEPEDRPHKMYIMDRISRQKPRT